MLARPSFLVAMHPRPGAFLFELNFQHGRAVRVCKRLPDLVALASFAEAFGIAGVIGQNFLGAGIRRAAAAETPGAVAARDRRPASCGCGRETGGEKPIRFQSPAPKPISTTLSSPAEAASAARAHPLAPQPCGRRQMGMIAEQLAQLGQADAGGPGQGRGIGEILRAGRAPAPPGLRTGRRSRPRPGNKGRDGSACRRAGPPPWHSASVRNRVTFSGLGGCVGQDGRQ